eukprot:scpid73809/ scgid24711/ 
MLFTSPALHIIMSLVGDVFRALFEEINEFVRRFNQQFYLAGSHKQAQVNALLDEGSTRSSLNGDVAAELGLSKAMSRFLPKRCSSRTVKAAARSVQCTAAFPPASICPGMQHQ